MKGVKQKDDVLPIIARAKACISDDKLNSVMNLIDGINSKELEHLISLSLHDKHGDDYSICLFKKNHYTGRRVIDLNKFVVYKVQNQKYSYEACSYEHYTKSAKNKEGK